MLKYVTKLTMEIVPSVAATVLGAYIVNHYITAKPETRAAAVATVAPKAVAAGRIDSGKADGAKVDGAKGDAKPAETSAEISGTLSAGIKAKGAADRPAAEKPAEAKPEVKATETASLPPEKPHGAPKSAARPVEAQEEHRDATDLARAAIERLRASEGARSPEASRTDQARIVSAAPQVSPVRPLPPPISVSAPENAPYGPGNPAYTGTVQVDGRVTPPADIPEAPARPLDLRADRTDPSLKDQMSNVAQDMVSAARSVFHSVLPK
jgi:hypothetical protein